MQIAGTSQEQGGVVSPRLASRRASALAAHSRTVDDVRRVVLYVLLRGKLEHLRKATMENDLLLQLLRDNVCTLLSLYGWIHCVQAYNRVCMDTFRGCHHYGTITAKLLRCSSYSGS